MVRGFDIPQQGKVSVNPLITTHICGSTSGLRKALVEECNDVFRFYASKITKEPLTYPAEKQEWKRGSFSWLYVRGVEFYTGDLFDVLEKIAMAAGKKKAKSSAGFDNYSFVRCELNSDDKKAAKIWIEENSSEMGAITHDAIADGYKLSVSFSSDHDTFTASLTGKEGALNEYKTMTARHKDWIVAVMTVMYKNAVMFKSGVWETDTEEDDGWA